MTEPKILDLVCVNWPGSSSGDNRKWALVARDTSTRIGVKVCASRPSGEYTGTIGSEIRWFRRDEIAPKVTLLDVPAPLRPLLSERQAAELARLEAKAEKVEARAEKPAEPAPAKKAKAKPA